MTEPSPIPSHEPAPPTRPGGPPLALRLAMLALLLALAAVAWYVVFRTPFGEQLRDRDVVLGWVRAHRVIAPLILVGTYVLFAVLLLPVWWLQVLAGYCFGLVSGVIWCALGAVIGAVLSLVLSRWLVGQWFRQRYESRVARLHEINEKLGHNGLLVVMSVRACHLLPFGLSNYLFGLTRITVIDVALGTFGGGIITIAIYVAVGVGRHLLRDWRLWTVLGALNILMLVPLVLRYLKPEWFKKIGVE